MSPTSLDGDMMLLLYDQKLVFREVRFYSACRCADWNLFALRQLFLCVLRMYMPMLFAFLC